MAYIRGMSDQLREWEMGSFYWPGLRDGDWYSMTKRTGEGANIKLEIVNQSGVDRMKMAWADTIVTDPPEREAYEGKIAVIPGKIEAENYDVGGNRFTFYDKDSENQGKAYREDAVDIESIDDAACGTVSCKGYALGYTQSGEWLEYSVNVESDAELTLTANVATASETAGFQLFMDGKAITDSIKVAKIDTTWKVYKEIEIGTVKLEKGEHILRILITGAYVNIDWLQFTDPNTTRIESRPISREVHLSRLGSETLKVFSMTGRFLGNVNPQGPAAASIEASLKAAGFANGVYLVRGAGVTRRIQVR
jgi:hypothetical protein